MEEQNILNNDHSSVTDRVRADFTSELLSALSSDDNLQKFADIGYKYIGLPVLISGSNWKVLASAPDIDIPEDPSWTAFRTDGLLSNRLVLNHVKSDLISKIENHVSPFIHKDRSMAYRRMFMGVLFKHSFIGSVSILEYERDFTESDSYMLSILCDALCIHIKKKKLFYDQSSMIEDYILISILDGDIEEGYLSAIAKELSMSDESVLRVYAMDIKGSNTWRDLGPYLRNNLRTVFARSVTAIYGNYLVAVASYNTRSFSDKDYLRDIENLKEFLEIYNLKSGASRAFRNLKRLRTFFDQAAEAMEIGIHIDKSRRVNIYDDYEIYHISHICSMHTDLVEFIYPRLTELMEYDSAHRTTYTESLYVFFKHHRNITEAAKALHLHRNTLVYQMNKINEILGVDLEEGDHMLLFELSFKFMEYEPKLGGNYIAKLGNLDNGT